MNPARRFASRLAFVALASSVAGCFALFSLDGYNAGDEPIIADAGPREDVVVPVEAEAGPTDLRPTKKVFVTSALTNGNFNGVKGADALCATAATSAGLDGTFKAWVSDKKDTPQSRFSAFSSPTAGGPRGPDNLAADGGPAAVRLVDTTNRTVATSWFTLISDQQPLLAIDRDERGQRVVPPDAGTTIIPPPGMACTQTAALVLVWTNTTAAGEAADPNDDCSGFLDTGGGGTAGIVARAAPGWTEACRLPCTAKAHLYCFEQ